MLNKGRSGSGNETISRATINSAMKHRQIDHMYIMWSGPDRYEVITEDKGKDDVKDRITYFVWDDDFQWSTWYGGHPDKDKNEYYRKHFWNVEHQYYRTLEHILRTQMLLDRKGIPYTMMIYNKHTLRTDFHSESERFLYNQIDWSKFLFYKETEALDQKYGLQEYGLDNFAEYYTFGDSHPPPIVHYHWVKDVMFESDILCPEDEYNKLKDYFKGKDGRSRI
jgi:hypothetical protein